MKQVFAAISFLLFLNLFLSSEARADQPMGGLDSSSTCIDAYQYQCDGDCADGFGLDCYHDSRATKIEDDRSLYDQKTKCYGLYDMSRCNPCQS